MDQTFLRTVVAFLIGLLAGLFIGWWAGRGVAKIEAEPPPEGPVPHSSPADPATGDAGQAPTEEPWIPRVGAAGDASRTAPGAVVPAAEERIRELEAQVETLRERLTVPGAHRPPARPVQWPDDRPEKFTEAGFRSVMEEALSGCDVPLELQRLDCAEPPCIAVMRTTSEGWHAALVNDCPTWNETYGTTVSMDDGTIDCVGAEEEGYALLSPFDHEWREELDKDEQGNVGARLQERWDAIKTDWDCR